MAKRLVLTDDQYALLQAILDATCDSDHMADASTEAAATILGLDEDDSDEADERVCALLNSLFEALATPEDC